MTERAAQAGLEIWIVPQKRGLDLGWIADFAIRLRRQKIDVLHTHEFAMNVFGGIASRLAWIPSVSTLHGKHWVADRRRRAWAYRALRRAGVPIVAVSKDLASFLVAGLGIPERDLRVIHNGVATVSNRGSPPDRATARRAVGIPEAGRLCVAVGNLYPVKDHATLIRAAGRIPELRIAIAGRGEEEARLLALARDLGIAERVHLLGLRDDIGQILESADLFAQPSLSEGLPLAVLEAMSLGLPVVASDVGGISEAVEHGRSGILVAPGRDEELARAIQQILDDDEARDALGRAARARVEAEFSMDSMTDRYEALYRELIG